MLSYQDKSKYADYLGRIIFFAVSSKIHLELITDKIAKSSFIDEMERDENSLICSRTSFEIFYDIFGIGYISDSFNMNYNGAYWCGYIYAKIFFEYRKPFSYIALKMPLDKLLDMYQLYHEMDISEVFEAFAEAESKVTIMKLLLKKHGISAAALSRKSGVALRTIARFKESDDYLYKGTYNNVYSLSRILKEPGNLFLKVIHH